MLSEIKFCQNKKNFFLFTIITFKLIKKLSFPSIPSIQARNEIKKLSGLLVTVETS